MLRRAHLVSENLRRSVAAVGFQRRSGAAGARGSHRNCGCIVSQYEVEGGHAERRGKSGRAMWRGTLRKCCGGARQRNEAGLRHRVAGPFQLRVLQRSIVNEDLSRADRQCRARQARAPFAVRTLGDRSDSVRRRLPCKRNPVGTGYRLERRKSPNRGAFPQDDVVIRLSSSLTRHSPCIGRKRSLNNIDWSNRTWKQRSNAGRNIFRLIPVRFTSGKLL